MKQIAQDVLTELRSLIADLGKGGGMMSPSVYNTAQVLRYHPSARALDVVQWLLAQQREDGGWGDPHILLARPVPTLATLLALQPYTRHNQVCQAVEAGERWLDQAGVDWPAVLPDRLPVGVELIFPALLVDAAREGLRVSAQPYGALIALGERRRKSIMKLPARPGTTAAHSWEAWGSLPDPALMDAIGSIGHSPSATAAWLHAAQGHDTLRSARAMAEHYLDQAATATKVSMPGVMPTAWPVNRFEQSNALYALLLADMLHHPGLQSVISSQVTDLNRAITTTGLGFTDWFDPDGDDTAMALAVVRACNQSQTLAPLKHFSIGDHFCAYQGELQSAPSVVAHALHAIAIFGENKPATAEAYLATQQGPDGRWTSDKWNASWLYTTSHALFAFDLTNGSPVVQGALRALLSSQSSDGGWGAHRVSDEETAYALIALNMLERHSPLGPAGDRARERGGHWLIGRYRPYDPALSACWQAKEIFRPYRVARVYELAAMLQSVDVELSFTAL